MKFKTIVKDNMKFNFGDRVIVDNAIKGTITGATFHEDPRFGLSALFLIRLDEGFFNSDRTVYISVLPAHPDNLELF